MSILKLSRKKNLSFTVFPLISVSGVYLPLADTLDRETKNLKGIFLYFEFSSKSMMQFQERFLHFKKKCYY